MQPAAEPTPPRSPHWQFAANFIHQSPTPVTLKQLKAHFEADGRNPNNAGPDAYSITVNSPSRVHYGGGKKLRRTDSGNEYDIAFQLPDGGYVPYDPEKHGVWEIYLSNDGKTKAIRKISDGVESEISASDADYIAGANLSNRSIDDGPETTFRLESHLRDYLAQNLSLFQFLGTKLSLYRSAEDAVGVEFQTGVGPIDILAEGDNGAFYVIELKVSRGHDATVGQVLRYMSAIRSTIAHGRPVYGVIVASTLSEKLKAALSEVAGKVFSAEYELAVSLQPHVQVNSFS